MIELLSNTGFIMYSKKAAKLFGVNGAILLGELCAKYQYWLDNGGLLENEGWFFCTREDIVLPPTSVTCDKCLLTVGIARIFCHIPLVTTSVTRIYEIYFCDNFFSYIKG